MTCESCVEKDRIISELKKRIELLERRNKDMEEQLKEISSYVWKPKRHTTTPQKLGPPAGHEPHTRPVPDTVHRTVSLSLKRCPECSRALSKPVRMRERYVEDIRPPEPLNTRYLIPVYYCRHCKEQVSPKPVEVIPKCRFGIKIMLLTSYLRYGMLLPFNKIASLLEASYGLRVTEGCLVDALTRFADHLGPEFEKIKTEIRESPYVHKDTTSWPINGKNRVLWTFVSEKHTLLLVRDTKAQGIVYQTLGTDYKGVSITDGAKEYQYLGWAQQTCWVHLLRSTRKLETVEGKALHGKVKELYHLAKSRKAGKSVLQAYVDDLLSIPFNERKCIVFQKRMEQNRDKLFTFMYRKGVKSDNNAAERGLRPSVVMRKITGGNRSAKGARNHEVIMSVMGTWQKQGMDFLSHGEEYMRNHVR